MPLPHLTLGKDPGPIVQEAGWASGPVWTGVENLAPAGIRSPDRPARRQLLYRLCYPAHSSQNSIPVIYSSSLLQVLFMKSPYQMAVTVLRWGACSKTVVFL